MAVEKFVDAGVFWAGWNYTGQSNQVTLNRSNAMLDATVFGNHTRVNTAGLAEMSASVSGFWIGGLIADGALDPIMHSRLGSTGAPLTLYPKDVDLGVAYMFPGVLGSINGFGALGELAPFDAEFNFSPYESVGVRSQSRGVIGLRHQARTGASGSGTGTQLGAVTSSQYLVLCVQLTATDSSDVEVILESDDNGAFTTPTTRITTGSLAGGTGGQAYYAHLAGPLTDDWYRLRWVRTGGSTFTALGTFGVYTPLSV